jgi:predicted Fe-S protein YdhL (DUF1289 family)
MLCDACACVKASEGAQEMCRGCETLLELVALWHGLTPEVRGKIKAMIMFDAVPPPKAENDKK